MSERDEEVSSRPPNKFELRRAKTRSDLLLLGVQRFPIKGYGPTTIEDIVRDSRYTRGAFYFHFDSKEEFFLEVIRTRPRVYGDWVSVVHDPAVTDLRSALLAVVMRFRAAEPDAPNWTLLIAAFVEANRHNDELIAQLRGFYAGWIEDLSPLIPALQERGFCRTDLTPEQASHQLLAVTEGFGALDSLYGAGLEMMMDVYVRLLEP
ncbi:TetR/AcrR family transcriptional regulator [Demequina sediminicola]|uniref:TetR/AcrR family transcriptional regulator n=1 Tax=Demequina sediminicola TaxID=1095026 RepID=UPI000783E923|nr:TetR/AcrR family transcriptional regulator [Demequina sediminicola]